MSPRGQLPFHLALRSPAVRPVSPRRLLPQRSGFREYPRPSRVSCMEECDFGACLVGFVSPTVATPFMRLGGRQ